MMQAGLDFTLDDVEPLSFAVPSSPNRRRAMARKLADNIKGDLAAYLLAETTLRTWGLSLAEFGVSRPSTQERRP